MKFILREVDARDEPLLCSVTSYRNLLGKLERGQAVVVALLSQPEGRAFNVVISDAPISHNYCIDWEFGEKKAAFALDPGIPILGHILILAHDLVP